MRTLITVLFFSVLALFYAGSQNICTFAMDETPKRLVVIKGKAIILNHPTLGETPHAGGTIMFQKIGCDSCFVGTNADIDGNYKVMVGDGKYKVVVRNPSSPEIELLAPGQERVIDTEGPNPNQVLRFDIKIRLPK